jgi:hypothetical protein
MSYRVEEDHGRRLVHVVIEGAFDKRDVAAMVAQARERSSARGWNILYDVRAARPGDMGPGDLFWIPRNHPALRDPKARAVRVAVIHPPALADLAAFWETSFRNAGIDARAFSDEAAVMAWLAP